MSEREEQPVVEGNLPTLDHEEKPVEPQSEGEQQQQQQQQQQPLEESEDAPAGNVESNLPPTAPEEESQKEQVSENKERADDTKSDKRANGKKDPSVEEEVAQLLQNLANKPSEENVSKRARRSTRERKSSLYSDYETEFKGNWDQVAAPAPRRKNQNVEVKRESAKEMYNGFDQKYGRKITENSKRLLDLLQSSAKQGRSSQLMPLVAPAPSWKPSRLSIAKFIESKMSGRDIPGPREFETAFSRVAPVNTFAPQPMMNLGNGGIDKHMDTARLMSLLSSLTNQPGGMPDDRQQAMHAFSQSMSGGMQQTNPGMLQSLLNSTLQNQQQMHQYPPYRGGMHAPSYHQ